MTKGIKTVIRSESNSGARLSNRVSLTRYPFRTCIRFPTQLVKKIDAFADENGMTRGGAVRYLATRQLKYLEEDRARRAKGILRPYYKPDVNRFTDAEISDVITKLRTKGGVPPARSQIIYNLIQKKKEQRGRVKSPMVKGMEELKSRVEKALGKGHVE